MSKLLKSLGSKKFARDVAVGAASLFAVNQLSGTRETHAAEFFSGNPEYKTISNDDDLIGNLFELPITVARGAVLGGESFAKNIADAATTTDPNEKLNSVGKAFGGLFEGITGITEQKQAAQARQQQIDQQNELTRRKLDDQRDIIKMELALKEKELLSREKKDELLLQKDLTLGQLDYNLGARKFDVEEKLGGRKFDVEEKLADLSFQEKMSEREFQRQLAKEEAENRAQERQFQRELQKEQLRTEEARLMRLDQEKRDKERSDLIRATVMQARESPYVHQPTTHPKVRHSKVVHYSLPQKPHYQGVQSTIHLPRVPLPELPSAFGGGPAPIYKIQRPAPIPGFS